MEISLPDGTHYRGAVTRLSAAQNGNVLVSLQCPGCPIRLMFTQEDMDALAVRDRERVSPDSG